MDLFCLEINSGTEAPCVNGVADRIRSVNYEIVLKSRIFFACLGRVSFHASKNRWANKFKLISRKAFFAPCSLLWKYPINFAVTSGKGNTYFKAKRHAQKQCCGSMTFWGGSGSADPCLWLMDPRIRTRIRGSVPLTNGSVSWIRILLFSSLTFKTPAKN